MSWFEDIFVKIAANRINREVNMADIVSVDTPWYKNKSTLAHLLGVLATLATSLTGLYTHDFGGHIPDALIKIGGFVLLVAHSMGIYENHAT